MKNIVNDYCIRQFVSGDVLRPQLTKVCLHDGYLYATDTHILAKINADLCVHNYETIENYPDVEYVISKHESIEKKIVSVDTIFNELIRIECCFKPKMIECDGCHGNCSHICEHCGSEYDCKTCGGAGILPGNELELISQNDCVLFGKKYRIKHLDLIIKTAIYTGVKEIEISNSDGFKPTAFTVGDFNFILIPRFNE